LTYSYIYLNDEQNHGCYFGREVVLGGHIVGVYPLSFGCWDLRSY